jgi:hypothetical protein
MCEAIKLICLAIFLLMVGSAAAQDSLSIDKQKAERPEAKQGTFQLQVSSVKHVEFALNDEALIYFESLRRENEDLFIPLRDNVTLYLPSLSQIRMADYRALNWIEYK